MADATAEITPEDSREKMIFRYVNWTSAAILAIVVSTFFVPIPAANSKYVDIAIGILLGILSSNSGTVTGNTTSTKKSDPISPINGDNGTVNNTITP